MSQPQILRSRPVGRDRSSLHAPRSRPSPPRLPKKHQAVLILADAGLAEAFFLIALLAAQAIGVRSGAPVPMSGPLPVFLAILFPLVVGSRGLYRLGRFPSWRGQAAAGVRAVAWSVGVSVVALFVFAREIPYALRLVLVLYHLMLGAWMVAVRPLLAVLLVRRFAAAHAAPVRVLLVGSDRAALETARIFSRRPAPAEVLGFTDVGSPAMAAAQPYYSAELEDLPELAGHLAADVVVLARPDLPREEVVRLTDRIVARGIQVRVASNVFNRLVDSIPGENYGGVALAPLGQTPLNRAGEGAKRIFDLAAAVTGGVLILPVIAVLALLVRLSSPGPILFRQIRIGRDGRPFIFYKFRSMRVTQNDDRHRRYVEGLLQNGQAAGTDAGGQKVYKLIDDDRITGIGRFLRRTSLDELPQLINVLRGEMSLVGPRPCLPFEYELYKDWQKRRLAVTPGMTGLWQVTGRSYVTFEDMVLLDLFYIANWSFWMDLKLMGRTLPVVVWGKGAL